MDALPHGLKVAGAILTVWTVVPGVALVVVPRVWCRYYKRTDGVPTGKPDRPRTLAAGSPEGAASEVSLPA